MIDPFPCPFCYATPETDDCETGGTVECCAKDCPVHPSIFCDHEQDENGLEMAIERWNERVDPFTQVYWDIVDERQRQDAKWGGPKHDDAHEICDFVSYIQIRLDEVQHCDRTDARRLLIQIAALAVAAVESIDRRRINVPETAEAAPKEVSDGNR